MVHTESHLGPLNVGKVTRQVPVQLLAVRWRTAGREVIIMVGFHVHLHRVGQAGTVLPHYGPQL